MTRGVRLYLVGSFVLVSLAGCGRGLFQAEREPWRAEAEVACLKSGAVREGPELVRIDPISGPGMCGAQFPLKVAAFGEASANFGYSDELRPTGEYRQPAALAGLAAPAGACALFRQRASPAELRGAIRTDRFRCPRRASPPGKMKSSCPPRAGRASRLIAGAPAYPPRDRIRPLYRSLFAAISSAPATARPGARRSRCRRRSGSGQADGDAGLSDRIGAGALARRFRAAGGHALVRRAGRRDQADLRLFLPRHERQSECAYFRARVRQCARYRRLHARRRTPHHGQGRLEGHAGRAGVLARRAGRRLPAVQHRAGAGVEPLSLRSHPCRPDAPRERPRHLSASRRLGRRGRGARGRPQLLRLARTLHDRLARWQESRAALTARARSTRKTSSRTSSPVRCAPSSSSTGCS